MGLCYYLVFNILYLMLNNFIKGNFPELEKKLNKVLQDKNTKNLELKMNCKIGRFWIKKELILKFNTKKYDITQRNLIG